MARKPAAPVDDSQVLPTTVGERTVASAIRNTFGSAKYTGDSADAAVISKEGWRPDFPSELHDASEPQLVVSIGYFRLEGQAWGQHSVFVVFTTD